MVAAIPRDTEDQIIAAYQNEGVAVRVIGERHGVTRESVFNVLRRRGIPRRRRPGGKRKEFTPEEQSRIGELRRQQWAVQEIADEFHTSNERVIRALDELGLPRRMLRRDAKERIITNQGYAAVIVPPDDPMRVMSWSSRGSYVFEHRLVMARSLGRPLRPDETVHHVNGDRLDNRLENLQLRQGNHGKGALYTCRSCGSHDVEARELH